MLDRARGVLADLNRMQVAGGNPHDIANRRMAVMMWMFEFERAPDEQAISCLDDSIREAELYIRAFWVRRWPSKRSAIRRRHQ